MANPTYDNSTTATYISGGGTYTTRSYSYTVGAFNNRVLVVMVNGFDVTNITFNDVEMTDAGIDTVFSGSIMNLQTFYLLNPDVGAHDIAITWGSAVAADIGGAISFYGVAQTGQPEDADFDSIDFGATSVTLTLGEDDCVYIGGILSGNNAELADGETNVVATDIGSVYFQMGYNFADTGSRIVSSNGGGTEHHLNAISFSPKIGSDFDAMLLADYA